MRYPELKGMALTISGYQVLRTIYLKKNYYWDILPSGQAEGGGTLVACMKGALLIDIWYKF